MPEWLVLASFDAQIIVSADSVLEAEEKAHNIPPEMWHIADEMTVVEINKT